MNAPAVEASPRQAARRRGLWTLLVVFVLGMVCGAAALLLSARAMIEFGSSRQLGINRLQQQLSRHLDLTEAQQDRLGELTLRARGQTLQELSRASHQLDRFSDELREELRKELTPAQQRRLDEYTPRSERRYRSWLEQVRAIAADHARQYPESLSPPETRSQSDRSTNAGTAPAQLQGSGEDLPE